MNINKILVIFILLIMIATTVTYAKENTLPKGFQKLSDVELLNDTDLIDNDTLIPEGFYIPLEKKLNATKMIELDKQHNKQKTKFKMEKNLLGKYNKNIANNETSVSGGCSDISDTNITFEKVKYIWNSTQDGYLTINVVKDLDGDNLKDTLTTTYRYDSCTDLYYYTIDAKKGKDGTILWSESFSGKSLYIYWDLIDDVDGDHLNDIMVKVEEYDPISGKYYTQLKAKKGKSGVDLWKESAVEGFISERSLGDINGDGKNDILVDIDYYNPYIGILKAKKGIDGSNLWQESITNGNIYGTTVDDLNGDKLNDVLVEAYGSGIETLKAKKGIDGSNLWQESVTNQYVYGYPAGDLNGDGLNEIYVSIQNKSYLNNILKAKKGIDGSNLWQDGVTNGYMYGNSVGDISGDRLNDILIYKNDYDSNTQTISAKKGIDGSNLWQESVPGQFIYPYTPGDLNGDKLDEILIYKNDYGSNVQTLVAKRGIDGSNLWQESVTNGYISVNYAGDLNGDGLNDLLVDIYSSGVQTLKAIKGIDGYNLWQDSGAYIYSQSIGDLNGDKLRDVILETGETLKAKKGIDGNVLWQENNTNGIHGNSAGDQNGDGLNDILVDTYDYTLEMRILKVNKGIDGSSLWTAKSNSMTLARNDECTYKCEYVEENTYDYDLNGEKINDMLLYTTNRAYLVTAYISTPISITVVSPNGGEIWQSGSTKTVKWSYKGNPGSTVNVDLLKNGVLVKTIASSVSIGSNGNGTYSWKMDTSRTPGTDYKIRITSTSNSAYTDVSDNNFTIIGPIIVTSPNGGENWRHGTSHTITWSKAGSSGSYVKIELLRSGSVVKTITSSTSNDGSYSWSISSTQTPATDYQIRITSTSNSAYKDTSDNYFTLST